MSEYDANTLENALGVTDNSWSYLEDCTVNLPVGTAEHRVEIVDRNKHVEGDWHTNLFVVLKVIGPDGEARYFKKTGYYQSHEGSEWDGAFVEVEPKIQTVTVWNETSVDAFDYNSFERW